MKQDILKIFILLLALSVARTLSAQTDDALLQQLHESKILEPGAVLTQEGSGNEAFIMQVTEAANSSGIEALQAGNENRIRIRQTGSYIDIRISQEGTGNIYEADIEGVDSKIDISQSGFENIIFQSLMLNNSGISIQQQGDKNEVIHTGTSTNSGIQIQQQGSGMKLIIQSN